MSFFRKAICFALVAVLAAALFCGCGEKKAPFDAEVAFGRILTEVKFAEELEDSSEYAEYTFGELPEGTKVKHFAATGKCTDTVMLFTVQNESDLDAVETVVRDYLNSLKNEADRYEPEEVPKLQNAVIYRNGTNLIVCVTADTETVNSILR